MKICFFNGTKTWGGGEEWHFSMAEALYKSSNDNVVIIAKEGSALAQKAKANKIPLLEFPINKFSYLNPIKIFKLGRLFKHHQIDSLILNGSSDLKLAGLAAKTAKIKQVIYRRGLAFPIKPNWINKLYFKHLLTGIIANSEATKRNIPSNLFPQEKITVIYNGIDFKPFQIQNQKKSHRKSNEFIIGNVGRLVPQKNQEFLITIALRLKEKKIPFKIKVAGDGPLRKSLEQLTRKNGLQDHLIWLGFQDDIPAFLAQIDLFVLTSLWEGFGFVLAEAMASKKPVIAFAMSSNLELIDQGENGYLIPENNIDEFIARIIHLYEHPLEQKAMGEKGYEKSLASYSKSQSMTYFLRYLHKKKV